MELALADQAFGHRTAGAVFVHGQTKPEGFFVLGVVGVEDQRASVVL